MKSIEEILIAYGDRDALSGVYTKSSKILRVRVVCPLEQRILGYAEREGLTEKQARKAVVGRDADRADFIQHHFKQDTGAPSDYDLVLNAGTLSLEQMAEIVLAAYETKVGKRIPVTG